VLGADGDGVDHAESGSQPVPQRRCVDPGVLEDPARLAREERGGDGAAGGLGDQEELALVGQRRGGRVGQDGAGLVEGGGVVGVGERDGGHVGGGVGGAGIADRDRGGGGHR